MAVTAVLAIAALAAVMYAQAPAVGDGPMKGKVVLITGSTDGLGREVARRVAALGAHVIVHGRNQERGTALVQEIAQAGRGSASFHRADLASLADVRALAQAVLRDHTRLDVLVNNAGIWLNDGTRQVSADGHELHFAVNYLSGFLLTRMLLPRLRDSAPSRIVNVASGSQAPIDFTDVMLTRPGRASRGYGQSKLAQIMFTVDLAGELKGSNVSVVALHPATMMDTTMVRQSGMPSRSTVDEGAKAVMNLITGQDIESGSYFNGLRPARAHEQAYDPAALAKLRDLSMTLTALTR